MSPGPSQERADHRHHLDVAPPCSSGWPSPPTMPIRFEPGPAARTPEQKNPRPRRSVRSGAPASPQQNAIASAATRPPRDISSGMMYLRASVTAMPSRRVKNKSAPDCFEREAVVPGHAEPDGPGGQLDQGIKRADRDSAAAAFSPEQNPREHRNVVIPRDHPAATGTLRAGADDRLVRREPDDAHVEKAAEHETEQAGDDRNQKIKRHGAPRRARSRPQRPR